MSLLALLFQLSYAILGKDSVYCWTEKQDSKMNILACLFLATGGTSKCKPQHESGAQVTHGWSLRRESRYKVCSWKEGDSCIPPTQLEGQLIKAKDAKKKKPQCREKRYKVQCRPEWRKAHIKELGTLMMYPVYKIHQTMHQGVNRARKMNRQLLQQIYGRQGGRTLIVCALESYPLQCNFWFHHLLINSLLLAGCQDGATRQLARPD